MQCVMTELGGPISSTTLVKRLSATFLVGTENEGWNCTSSAPLVWTSHFGFIWSLRLPIYIKPILSVPIITIILDDPFSGSIVIPLVTQITVNMSTSSPDSILDNMFVSHIRWFLGNIMTIESACKFKTFSLQKEALAHTPVDKCGPKRHIQC